MSLRIVGLGSRCTRTDSISLSSTSFSPFSPKIWPPQSLPRASQRSIQIARQLPPRSPQPLPSQNGPSKVIRRSIQQRFQPFVPPSPASLGKAKPAKYYPRLQKWGRRLIYVSAATGVLYLIDSQLYASSITRSLRTFGLGLVVAADYKLNFRAYPLLGGTIGDLHRRNAERMFNLLHQNGGLYLKVLKFAILEIGWAAKM